MNKRAEAPRVLVTGFGPFPGVPVNMSSALATAIGQQSAASLPDVRVIAETLPTEWRGGIERLDALWLAHRPAVALHFGVSDRATGFVLERVAYNASCDDLDACGEPAPASRHEADGLPLRQAAFDIDHLVRKLARRHVPVSASDDPGRYLCNAVYFRSLARADAADALSLFIHIPVSLAAPGEAGPQIDWDAALRGGQVTLDFLLARLKRRAPPVA